MDSIRIVLSGSVVLPAVPPSPAAPTVTRLPVGDLERTMLAALQRGETNAEIARAVHMSVRSVKRRLQELYARLEVSGRIQAAALAAAIWDGQLNDEPRNVRQVESMGEMQFPIDDATLAGG